MADGDGSTPGVVAHHVGLELAGPHEGDRGEGLVALNGVELVDGHARALQQLLGRRDRGREHQPRILRGNGEVADDRPVRQPEGVRSGPLGDEHGRRRRRDVWEALPAVMSGAIDGSQDAALGSLASDSTVLSGRMPWSRSNNSPVSAPSSSLIGHRHGLLGEVAVVPVLLGPAVGLGRVGVHVLAGDAVALGQDLADLELGGVEPPADGLDPLAGERPGAPGGVGAHGRAGHRLDAAGDAEVVGAGDHALGDEVHGLLGRAALAVDRGGGHVPGQAAGDPRVAGHVVGLLAHLADTAPDDVVDPTGIDPRPVDERVEREPQQVRRVPAGQRPLPLADRRADGVDDDGFTGGHGGTLAIGPIRGDTGVR